MKPASPVIPGERLAEVVFGAGQPQYIPLPAIRVDEETGEVITRWELDDADRAAIAAGGSIYLHVFTFGQALQPVRVCAQAPTLDILTPDGVRRIG